MSKNNNTHFCIGCNAAKQEEDLICLSNSDKNSPRQTEPGNKVYLCPNYSCYQKALNQNKLDQANLKQAQFYFQELEKIMGLFRLANRANKISLGRYAVRLSTDSKRAKLILFAKDANPKLINEFKILSPTSIPIRKLFLTKSEFGLIFGRNAIAVVAICDQQFANGLLKLSQIKPF